MLEALEVSLAHFAHQHQPPYCDTNMAPSVSSAVGNLLQSLTGIGASLINSVFAVIQAVVALLQELVGSVLQLVQAFVAFVADVCQGVIGFVVGERSIRIPGGLSPTLTHALHEANFFGVLLVGGVYYWYTQRQEQGSGTRSKKRIA